MKKIFIDPTYDVFLKNQLFDLSNPVLNRDGTLEPFVRFRNEMKSKGIEVMTYDYVSSYSGDELRGDGYISLGFVRDRQEIEKWGLIPLAFYLLEPPLVLPETYKKIPQLSQFFQRIFIHNTHGDGYDLSGVNRDRLVKLHWPQPYPDVNIPLWSNQQRNAAVVIINGYHKPERMKDKELYTARLQWGIALSPFIPVDLFGRGWELNLKKVKIWPYYWFNYFSIRNIYRGSCPSKLPLMSQYDFCLCFENMVMDGYITEKIFDCFYSGVIPIYRGGNDIEQWIPSNCYIDLRKFKDAQALANFLKSLTLEQKQAYREAGRSFILSGEGKKYLSMASELEQ